MSVTISTDIMCDGCGAWDDRVTQTSGSIPLRNAARVEARKLGWRCDRSGDYCPECTRKQDDR